MRGTRRDEVKKVIALINSVFRGERGNLPHTMEREFPLLLSQENSENMRIITEGERICSVVNFLPRRIAIEGIPVSTASIGAVCTSPHYRGRRYSTRILGDAEMRMKEMGVRICLISGTRNLYRKWGAGRVRNSIRHTIPPKKEKMNWRIREYRMNDLPTMKRLYNSQGTRYLRSSRDFDLLIDSGTFPFGDTSYYRYVMVDNMKVRGYIILMRTPEGVVVKEAAGERGEVFTSLAHLAEELGEEKIDYILPREENVPEGYRGSTEHLQGTLKIIDAPGLMADLQPYFRQYVEKNMAESFRVEERGEGYRLILGDEVLEISSHDELLKVIFENNRNETGKGRMKEFINRVFPLPFPWTENLNYQ